MAGDSFYFDTRAEGTAVFLGPTEARLMELAWRHESLTVKSALFHLGPNSNLAYTTVMTVLNRLSEKGLLARTREGRNFVYEPQLGRAAFIGGRIAVIRECLIKNFSEQTPDLG
jgi:predicted transcriptional regulator